ncbi:uncharacterized protein VTP21DRAFT_7327 [Calcarisporiella thermophila]|uniref:uncharacterized protein n=1 Tax=Calcarisporiella thermophila TaxID=911321 RepID=UPI0037436355
MDNRKHYYHQGRAEHQHHPQLPPQHHQQPQYEYPRAVPTQYAYYALPTYPTTPANPAAVMMSPPLHGSPTAVRPSSYPPMQAYFHPAAPAPSPQNPQVHPSHTAPAMVLVPAVSPYYYPVAGRYASTQGNAAAAVASPLPRPDAYKRNSTSSQSSTSSASHQSQRVSNHHHHHQQLQHQQQPQQPEPGPMQSPSLHAQSDPFYNPLHVTNIYVRGLPPSTTDDSFYNMCCAYGKINSSKAIIDSKNDSCKGYGFVMYETEEEAKKAIHALNQMGFQVSFAKDSFGLRMRGMQEFGSTNLYFANLPLDMDEQKLEEMLLPYKTEKSQIFRHPETNVSRGIGWAKMSDRQSAEACITKFNNSLIAGCTGPLQVRFAHVETQHKTKTGKKQKTLRVSYYTPQFTTGPVTPESVLGVGASAINAPLQPQPMVQTLVQSHDSSSLSSLPQGYYPYYAVPIAPQGASSTAAAAYPAMHPIYFASPHPFGYASSVSDETSSLNLDSSGRTTPTSSYSTSGEEEEGGRGGDDDGDGEEEDISGLLEGKLMIGEPRQENRIDSK